MEVFLPGDRVSRIDNYVYQMGSSHPVSAIRRFGIVQSVDDSQTVAEVHWMGEDEFRTQMTEYLEHCGEDWPEMSNAVSMRVQNREGAK